MLMRESKMSRIHGHINTEGCIMEIWALSSDEKHSWHGNYIFLLPPGRLLYQAWRCVAPPRGCGESSNAEEKPVGWYQAPEQRVAKRNENYRTGVECKGPDLGPSKVRKSRKGHRGRAHMGKQW